MSPRRGGSPGVVPALIVLVLACLPAPAGSGEVAPSPSAEAPGAVGLAWDIAVEGDYDPATGVLAASERLTWRNLADTPADELRLHLWLNAFRDDRSTWRREALWRRSPSERRPDGGLDLLAVTGPGGADWTGRVRYVDEDTGNPDDRTVAVIPLDEPVPPGGEVTLELAFRARFPGIFARTGRAGDYLAATRWIPVPGVFESPGPGEPARWNCRPFHKRTEFYADFGHFRVTVSFPERYEGKVAGTGRIVHEETRDGRYVVSFDAAPVHAFALFADPRFVVVRHAFRGDEHRDPGDEAWWREVLGPELRDGELELPDVEVVLYLQPDHRSIARRYLATLEFGLTFFGRAFGPYPWPVLRVIDPPVSGGGSGGMEYPMLISCGSHLLVPPERESPEVVTMHEFGHQYFYGLVANSEQEHAFLDEGFNTFAESTALDRFHGPDVATTGFFPFEYPGSPPAPVATADRGWGRFLALGDGTVFGFADGLIAGYVRDCPPLTYVRLEWLFPWRERQAWVPRAGSDRVLRQSWTYPDHATYRAHVYKLTGLTLETWRRVAGDRALWRALRRYVREQRFRHPRPGDFVRAACAVREEMLAAGETDPSAQAIVPPADEFFATTWGTAGWTDFEAAWIRCAEDPPPEDAAGAEGQDAGAGATTYTCRALVRQRGPWSFPVEIELRYDGGETELVTWDGKDRWVVIERRGPHRVRGVVVDPGRRYPIDVDLLNNQVRRGRTGEDAWRVFLALLHQLAERLLVLGRHG